MKVSCIIATYNEGSRITGVLNVVIGHELIDEVIVINDGSTDGTKEVLEQQGGITLISYDNNKGKTFAVMTGLEKSRNDLVILIDADLVDLTKQNITDLILPVIQGQSDITISLRKNSLLIFKLLGLDFVSGERVFPKKIIGDLKQLAHLRSFGLEVFMNSIIIKNKFRIKIVPWSNVSHFRKSQKFGWWQGMERDYSMVVQIIRTIKISGLISQIYRMRLLRVP